MKALRFIAGGLVAALLISTASAQTVIRIAGANALRNPLNQALRAVVQNNPNGGLKYGWSGTSNGDAGFTSALQVVITGTTVGGKSVIIQTDLQGSLAGDRDLVLQTNPPTNNWLSPTANALSPTGVALGALNSLPKDTAGAPNFAVVDQPQDATSYISPRLSELKVGVIVYGFARGNGSSSSITNITNQQARVLFSNGQLNLSQFTGIDSDLQPVSWIGRDVFAGVRLVTFAETGFGITSIPTQYETFPDPTTTDTTSQITSVITGGTFSGATGYTSNPTLVNQLRRPINNATAGHLIGAAGMPDLLRGNPNIEQSGGKVLSFNGVPYTDDNVRNGLYTFWSYAYFSRLETASGDIPSLHDEIAAELRVKVASIYANEPNKGLLTLDTMNVSRAGEGTPVFYSK